MRPSLRLLNLPPMCGRYSLASEDTRYRKRFGYQEASSQLALRFNIAPTQNAAVIVSDGAVIRTQMRWGLIPFWAKDESIGGRMINAHAETLAEKPAFRSAFTQRCCPGAREWILRTSNGSSVRPELVGSAAIR